MNNLHFHNTFSANKLQLFEVSEELLTAFMSDEVSLKGLSDGHAVLVTSDATFSMKRQENSNKQLIVDNDGCIHGDPGSVIKLERIYSPTVNVALVPESVEDEDAQAALFKFAAASDTEIRNFLRDHPEVLEEQGCFRKIQATVKAEMMRAVIIAAASLAPTDRGYEVEEVWLRAVDGYASEISLSTVHGLLASIAESTDARFARLCSEKIKRALVWQIVVLKQNLTLPQAVELWTSALSLAPLSASAEDTLRALDEAESTADETSDFLRYGRGLFVCEDYAGHVVLRICNAATLASEPRARLKELFAIKKKWDRSDLATYLAPVLGEEASVDNFLLKLTRQHNVGDRKTYSSLF